MATLFRAVGASGGTPKSLFALVAVAENYMTLESPVGTDYQVTAGKTFKITRIIFAGGAVGRTVIGYGDNGVADGAVEPTNPVYIIGNSGNAASVLTVPAAATMYTVDIYAEVPAGKYPFIKSAAGNTQVVQVIGVEE